MVGVRLRPLKTPPPLVRAVDLFHKYENLIEEAAAAKAKADMNEVGNEAHGEAEAETMARYGMALWMGMEFMSNEWTKRPYSYSNGCKKECGIRPSRWSLDIM